MRAGKERKRDDFKVPIVNFQFICSNIPASSAYEVHISQLIQYSRADVSCHDFFDIVLLPMVPGGYVEIVTSKFYLVNR